MAGRLGPRERNQVLSPVCPVIPRAVIELEHHRFGRVRRVEVKLELLKHGQRPPGDRSGKASHDRYQEYRDSWPVRIRVDLLTTIAKILLEFGQIGSIFPGAGKRHPRMGLAW